ncbi:hypothetical protein T11_12480 [Trichinella zimbabwensis]|uniref:Major sperm protein n=1 Tax=Trichinella zimbabwensis TaxID=268475 RepID=A0A0V1GX79_9BILA|nr:hypothetical protein T11_12480 [Trichinella zimbabwensis]
MFVSSINGCLTKVREPMKFIRITPSYKKNKDEEIRIFNSTESNVAFKVDSTRKNILITMPKYGIIKAKSAFYLKIRLLKLRTSNFDCKNDYISVHMIVAPKEKKWKKPAELWTNDSVLKEPMISYVIEVGYNKEIEGKCNEETSKNNSQRLESGEATEKAVKKDKESETFQSTSSTTYYSAMSGFESGSSIYYTAKTGENSESSEDTASVGINGKQDEQEKSTEDQCCER